MKLPPGWAGRPWDEREQRLGESPNGRKSCKTADPKEAVCKATCLKDGFQRNFTLPSCPMQTCSACRFTGSCLDFRHLARAGRFPLFIPLIFGTFHQGKVQKERFILAKEWRFRLAQPPIIVIVKVFILALLPVQKRQKTLRERCASPL